MAGRRAVLGVSTLLILLLSGCADSRGPKPISHEPPRPVAT
ncbi:hypothetical protein [Carbonactinospora thermoautotrophica]|nr:hypothetical protein [Carbonactinospora thermoautotrophica]